MKIALAQINPTIGDFEGNVAKMLSTAERAKHENSELIVFPEMSLCGYPPMDLLLYSEFIADQFAALQRLISSLKGIDAIIGFVDRNSKGSGKDLRNAAGLIVNGKLTSVHYKTLLPTYDVFDESRYFEPAETRRVENYRGLPIGISICEDAWNDADFWPHRLYQSDPISDTVKLGAKFLINISSSPYTLGKFDLKLRMYQHLCKKHRRPMAVVNQVGGNDELIFDGRSMIISENGDILALGADFEEDLIFFDTSAKTTPLPHPPADEIAVLHKALVTGIRDYARKSGFKKAVIGLSGGIDSALVAVLAAEALGAENVLGVAMPSPYSSEGSITDAQSLAKNLGIEFKIIPITDIFNSYNKLFEPLFQGLPADTTEQNIQARIRGNILMALSNKFGGLVLSTGNKSEFAVGYSTLYGDMCGGLSAICDVPKTRVYALANYINRDKEIIPRDSITKPPSAELKPNQKDQDDLPPYEILDQVLSAYIEEMKDTEAIVKMGFDRKVVEDAIRRIHRNEYKRRQAAPGPKLTARAFGLGRRLPLAQRWHK